MSSQAATVEQPRSVGARAGSLVAISGPYPGRTRRRVEGAPVANVALIGSVSAFNASLATGPQRLITSAVDQRIGPAVSPEQVAARQRMILLGNAATIALGVLAQRAVNHARWEGPIAEVARVTAAQLAIGGIANALVMVTDMATGGPEDTQGQESRSSAAVATAALTLAVQRRLLRRGAARVTLPRPSQSVTIPVRSGWRTREVQLQLAR